MQSARIVAGCWPLRRAGLLPLEQSLIDDYLNEDSFPGLRLISPIGLGSMGRVFRGETVPGGLPRALKVLRQELASDPEFVARFEREAAAAARIDHPNVVRVFGVHRVGRWTAIEMEYVPGQDVAGAIVAKGKLPVAESVALLRQVAAGLDAVHAAGLCHRDVKPGNILLSSDGVAKLTDFGIVKEPDSKLTGTRAFQGTPSYAAPEQFQNYEVSARSDVYALTCSAVEMLTGEVPFARDSFSSAMLAQLYDAPPRVAQRLGLPAGVDDVLAVGLEKVAADRYATSTDFVEDLERATAGLPPRLTGRQHGRRVRRQLLVGLALLAAIGVSVTLAMALWPSAGKAPAQVTSRAGTDGTAPPAAKPPRVRTKIALKASTTVVAVSGTEVALLASVASPRGPARGICFVERREGNLWVSVWHGPVRQSRCFSRLPVSGDAGGFVELRARFRGNGTFGPAVSRPVKVEIAPSPRRIERPNVAVRPTPGPSPSKQTPQAPPGGGGPEP